MPGIDFSNDPLLQGRKFSYLDTQLKRFGSSNFTHIPINAPKCPFASFQQDEGTSGARFCGGCIRSNEIIGHTPAAVALFDKAGLAGNRDQGFIRLNGQSDCSAFVTACRNVRYWDRRTD